MGYLPHTSTRGVKMSQKEPINLMSCTYGKSGLTDKLLIADEAQLGEKLGKA